MKAWAANLLGGAVAAATLAVGLVAGGPEAEAGGPAKAVSIAPPSSGGTSEVALGQAMQLFGRPARLSMFWTTDSTDEVLQHYSDAWKDAEVPPVIKRVDKVAAISLMDADSGLLRSVTVTDAGDQRIVVPSVMDARAFPDLTARHAPVPVPENAQGYLAQVTDDARSVAYHASFLVPMPPERALDFYKVELGRLGYAAGGSITKGAKGFSSLAFSRGPETVNVVASPTEKEGPTAAFVIVEDSRQVPEGGE